MYIVLLCEVGNSRSFRGGGEKKKKGQRGGGKEKYSFLIIPWWVQNSLKHLLEKIQAILIL